MVRTSPLIQEFLSGPSSAFFVYEVTIAAEIYLLETGRISLGVALVDLPLTHCLSGIEYPLRLASAL